MKSHVRLSASSPNRAFRWVFPGLCALATHCNSPPPVDDVPSSDVAQLDTQRDDVRDATGLMDQANPTDAAIDSSNEASIDAGTPLDVPTSIDTPNVPDAVGPSDVPIVTDVRDAMVTDTGVSVLSLPVSPNIVVDQFGYIPTSEKIAVIRNPNIGFDATQTFTPGVLYAVVNVATGAQLAMAVPTQWNAGAVDTVSGDRAWWFDFSSVTTTGNYVVVDLQRNVRSVQFAIDPAVYREVLRQALRVFYYQRAGQAKTAANAGAAWADGASHLGANQDPQARRFLDRNNAATARDLRGGWYDAGDYNKYTPWTAMYIIGLLRAYDENRPAWTDDANIPESGNGVPDVLDEVRWGTDFLARMQNADGSVLSIVGLSHASPPSAATGPSYYGDASTNSTLRSAAAFALAARLFRSLNQPAWTTYADGLAMRAARAWQWAVANPNVLFPNNSGTNNTTGLGAGNQETDAYGRTVARLQAAASLYALTGDTQYRTDFDANYMQAHLIQWQFVGPFEQEGQDALLEYAAAPNATAAVVTSIRTRYRTGLNSLENLGSLNTNPAPYMAYLTTNNFTWGSNATMSNVGNELYNLVVYQLDTNATVVSNARRAAGRYLHYLHGVNPLQYVYLTNMGAYGAERSVQQLYHTWFNEGTPWDANPAPGILTGGPNPSYSVDACCPAGCGSAANNAMCTSMNLTPPRSQPPAKSYKDFNNGWPLNSWEVTENSGGYQIAYLRLVSKFVP